MKQPFLGIVTLLGIISICFGIMSLCDEATFSTWVAYLFMSCIPAQIMFAIILQGTLPPITDGMGQPSKGLLLIVTTSLIGMIFAAISYYVVGKSHGVTPMLMMYTIMTVVVSFWFAVCWQCWPVSLFTKNPLIISVSLLAVAYIGAYLLFQWLFDFSFLKGAPVYFADIDPHGIAFAWTPLVIGVTTVAIIMSLILFDFWPVAKIINPTLKAIASSLLVFLISYGIYYLCVRIIGMDRVRFLVTVSVPFLFGIFLPLNLLQGILFPKMQQPAKGILLVAVSSLAALILSNMYLILGPLVTGPLAAGFKGNYQKELWLASALLGVTFPLIIVFTDYLNFWPLKSRED